MTAEPVPVTTDPRGRLTLAGHPSETFLRRDLPDGTVTLTPAVVVTALEREVMANAELSAYLKYAREHPDQSVPRPKRRRKA